VSRIGNRWGKLRLAQQFRQLGDIRRDPPRLIAQGAGNKLWATGFSENSKFKSRT